MNRCPVKDIVFTELAVSRTALGPVRERHRSEPAHGVPRCRTATSRPTPARSRVGQADQAATNHLAELTHQILGGPTMQRPRTWLAGMEAPSSCCSQHAQGV